MADDIDLEHIAIVGMAGRFPGASDVDTFWSNLCDGVESVRAFSDAELAAAGADPSDPGFINSGAIMDGIELFDAPFFGMSRREAELTDPQHRILLEVAWAALEHAGCDPGGYDGRIGVFGGVAANTYFKNNLVKHPELLERTGDYPLLLATEREYAITRIAYKLGFRGPALSVSTACSTSAVAAHLAVQSLLAGESDLALAGGARVRVPATAGYVYQEDGILSADGHCRPFDASARGTIVGSGAAFVVLKRLSDAISDGDTVYALIRGSAINNDGADKIGFTAPGVKGQAEVIREALAVADVSADSVEMVEAHGTGTSLGDPIEIAGLSQAFREDTQRRGYCSIGSLKANIGHLDAAAGVAGIIKAALSLYHERIPPSINFESPNPQIDFDASPFIVNTELRSWARGERPRRAGVSSFGLGGTNAHLVLEEAPLPDPVPTKRDGAPQVLTLSARTHDALARGVAELADHLEAHPELDLGDVAYTLQVGRARMPHRRSLVTASRAAAVESLRAPDACEGTDHEAAVQGAGVAFLFPGQGAQYVGMGAGLYRSEPVFADAIDRCAAILEPLLGEDLRVLLFSEPDDPTAATEHLMRTSVGQPASFTIQYAMGRLWMSWGLTPSVMIGHSVGEFAAACLGGVFALEDALRLVVRRGQLMEEVPEGRMLAIMAEPDVVTPLLDERLSLGAVNAPEQSVASGPWEAIEELEGRLADLDIASRALPVKVAFHSPLMNPIVEPLADVVRDMERGTLAIPMISTATGTWAMPEQLSDPEYWGTHARETVRFADAVGVLLRDRPDLMLLEVGPGQTLVSLASQHPDFDPDTQVLTSLPPGGSGTDEVSHILATVGSAWAAGADVDWRAVHGRRRLRVPLPAYPFEHEPYWIDGLVQPAGRPSSPRTEPATEKAATSPSAPATAAPAARGGSRKGRIAAELASILADLNGQKPEDLDPNTRFGELGFDSLLLTQANARFRKRFGVRVTLNQLFEQQPTIDSLAGYIDLKLDPDALPTPEPAPGPEQDELAVDGSTTAPTEDVEALVREQLRVMELQLELIGSAGATAPGDISYAGADIDAGVPASTHEPGPRANRR